MLNMYVIFVATEITTQEIALKGDPNRNQQTPYQTPRKNEWSQLSMDNSHGRRKTPASK